MKTAEQWLADKTWCDKISPNTGNFTVYGIEAIQADALEHAAKCAEYVAEHAAQDDPNTGDTMEGGEDVARGAQIAAMRIRLAAHDAKPIKQIGEP
jgi:hypothetical protein